MRKFKWLKEERKKNRAGANKKAFYIEPKFSYSFEQRTVVDHFAAYIMAPGRTSTLKTWNLNFNYCLLEKEGHLNKSDVARKLVPPEQECARDLALRLTVQDSATAMADYSVTAILKSFSKQQRQSNRPN